MYWHESDKQYAEFQMWKHKYICALKRGKEPPEPPEWYAERAKAQGRGKRYVYKKKGRPATNNCSISLRGVW